MSAPDELLDRNWQHFERLVARSERLLVASRDERAAVGAMQAAAYACFNHTGLFASDRLENLLTALSARELPTARPADATIPPASRGGAARVLHVATQVYDTGGHSQMLAQWIRADEHRDHHVCLTDQADVPVADKVLAAVGGRASVSTLDRPFAGLLGRAAALRELASGFDHVVLHVHPHDVVPSIALTGRAGPEVLYVNHADHLFWVGTHVLDRLVNLRESGQELAVERRGVPRERNAVLIRPLDLRARSQGRAEAKVALGIDPRLVVVASAAAAFKFEPVEGEGFLDVVLPVLERYGDTRLLVAGPDPVGEWAALADRGQGRATGLLPDVRPVLEAADVYVDSYPFSSLTSMLEAAALGTPVITLRAPSQEPAVLDADTPELADHLQVASSSQDLRLRLGSLVDNARLRQALGEDTAQAVREAHADGAWRRSVDSLLEQRVALPGVPLTPATRRTGRLDARVALLMGGGQHAGTGGSSAVIAPLLSWQERIVTVRELVRARRRPAALLLVPASWVRVVKRVRAAAG